jgi:hypothetical protein
VDGTVASLLLSPDGRWLYYLDATAGKVVRVNTTTVKPDRESRLSPGTDRLLLSPDGRTLCAVAGSEPGADGPVLQVLHPTTLERAKAIKLEKEPGDVALTDTGLALIAGTGREWSEVRVLDLDRGAVVASWGGVRAGSLLGLAADQKRLYVSSQGLTPGRVEALVLPAKPEDRPATYRAPDAGRAPLGGPFVLTPDGKFLLCRNGTVLQLADGQEADLKYHTSLPAFLAALVAPDLGAALLLAEDGTLKQYSYPQWKWQAGYRLDGVAYRAVLDAKGGRLYVATVDPRRLNERPRGGVGAIHVYQLKDVLRPAID